MILVTRAFSSDYRARLFEQQLWGPQREDRGLCTDPKLSTLNSVGKLTRLWVIPCEESVQVREFDNKPECESKYEN